MGNKKVLILWSGGLDSTYSVFKYLNDGYQVTACYMAMKNNKESNKQQLLAIERMLPYFKGYDKFTYCFAGSVVWYNNKGEDNNLRFGQLPTLLMTALYQMDIDTDEVVLSYVMNDDIISFMDELKKIWDALSTITVEQIPLTFPLMKTKKETILEKLPDNLKQLIWYCEFPVNDKKCNKCSSCKKMKDVLSKRK